MTRALDECHSFSFLVLAALPVAARKARLNWEYYLSLGCQRRDSTELRCDSFHLGIATSFVPSGAVNLQSLRVLRITILISINAIHFISVHSEKER